MAHRIEIDLKILDTRAEVMRKKLRDAGFSVTEIALSDVYTVDYDFSSEELSF